MSFEKRRRKKISRYQTPSGEKKKNRKDSRRDPSHFRGLLSSVGFKNVCEDILTEEASTESSHTDNCVFRVIGSCPRGLKELVF